jgi:NADH-quinone oxidoreductase subunit J
MAPVATTFFFYFLSALTVLSGVLVITRKNAVHSALALIVSLLGQAALYLMLYAPFVAGVQIILYAGGIMVLFLFVIMLLGVDKADDLTIEPFPIQRPLAAVVGIGLAGLLIAAIARAHDRIVEATPLQSDGDSNIKQLADNLFQDWVFAFEFTSILLIVAVAGTVLLSRKLKKVSDE